MPVLYHVSGWAALAAAQPGDVFTLLPGPQGAEGPGVYFSEGTPRFSAAEGARHGVAAVVVLEVQPPYRRWFRSKSSMCRKRNRPRTWHTMGRSLTLRVVKREGILLRCEEVVS